MKVVPKSRRKSPNGPLDSFSQKKLLETWRHAALYQGWHSQVSSTQQYQKLSSRVISPFWSINITEEVKVRLMHFSGGQVQPILSGLDSKQLSSITFHFNDSSNTSTFKFSSLTKCMIVKTEWKYFLWTVMPSGKSKFQKTDQNFPMLTFPPYDPNLKVDITL